jgi:hypothetical protein
MPDQEYRVFLSSTEKGLSTSREKIASILRRMTGIKLVRYEDFAASPEGGIERCLIELRRSDLLVLVCGPFLGSTHEGRSIVEIEYRAAIGAGIPCLVFLASSEFRIRAGDVENDNARKLLLSFKDELLSRHYCDVFSDESQLVLYISTAISNWQREQAEPKGFRPISSENGVEIEAIYDGPGIIELHRNWTGKIGIGAKDGPIYLKRVRIRESGVETEFSLLSNQLPRRSELVRLSRAYVVNRDNATLTRFELNEARLSASGLLLEPTKTNFAPPIREGMALPLLTTLIGQSYPMERDDNLIASIIGGSCKVQEYTALVPSKAGEPYVSEFRQEFDLNVADPLRIKINPGYLHQFRFITDSPIVHVQLEYGLELTSPIPIQLHDMFLSIPVTRAGDVFLINP